MTPERCCSGLLLAASTVAVGGQSDDPFSGQSWFFFAPLVIPLFILGVPLIDLVFAVVRRATTREAASRPPTRSTCTTG